MGPAEAKEHWERDGFVVLPGHLTAADLTPALDELHLLFPTADEFHDAVDEPGHARFRSEFGGITDFPFESPQLSLLAVHPKLMTLAGELLGTDRLRAYSIEAWAKYTDAADYDQDLHRDYLNHSLLVPEPNGQARQVELFLYLSDVPTPLGPPSYVSRRFTEGMPALPNWYPRTDGPGDTDHPTWASPTGRPDLYDAEVPAEGPAGTVVAYRIETFHRGTSLVQPRGVRYTIHANFRASDAEWISRRAWTDAADGRPWADFVALASPRQLELFGFPAPGHEYWTEVTLAGMVLRYPGFDPSGWQG